MAEKTKVVKVKAFPIEAKMTVGVEVTPAQILKLTGTGFLVEIQKAGLKTGEKFQIVFELPVVHQTINEPCVVVKVYTSLGNHIIEGHFQSLAGEQEQKILRFLSRIPRSAGST